jgi:hypothetical protein
MNSDLDELRRLRRACDGWTASTRSRSTSRRSHVRDPAGNMIRIQELS